MVAAAKRFVSIGNVPEPPKQERKSTGSSGRGGVGFFSLLALLFIGLKLTGHIDWSWWLVLGPLWMPIAFWVSLGLLSLVLAGVVCALAFVMTTVVAAFAWLHEKWSK